MDNVVNNRCTQRRRTGANRAAIRVGYTPLSPTAMNRISLLHAKAVSDDPVLFGRQCPPV